LGLAISKQLVEMMGGRIGVKSKEGKGSMFWFTASFEKQPPPAAPPVDLHPGLRDTKVLVVDDNSTNRSLVCRLLSAWGCRPEGSADGSSALATLRQAARTAEPFGMALLDMTLPGMDGEELGRRIAGDLQLKPMTIVLMTGFGRQCDGERLHALGFAGQVSKPIWARSLREALYRLGVKESEPVGPAKHILPRPSVAKLNPHARILVAEDNPTNQAVAVAMLKKLGYPADLVSNGLEVLQALRETDYDVVLMDCEMPEMDGYEATRRIREPAAGTRNPSVPIIAVTADAMLGDRGKCLQAGMNDYLSKPIEPQQLAAALSKWLMPVAGRVGPAFHESPVTADAVFNQEEFLARLMGDQDLARQVIAAFLSDAPIRFRVLRERLDAGDATGARLQAHALKGAAATVSAEALRVLSIEVQKAAAAGELSHASAVLSRMEEQFNLLKATLEKSGWI
jgi:CheY-like chemotaxis protein/HPt (histidine-containing phosphotransfer) domain-containing protein